MPGNDHPQAPFNEQAALAELERLQRALEASRQRRKQAAAAFDDFVGSFRKEPAEAVDPAPNRGEPRDMSSTFDALAEPPAPAEARRKSLSTAGIVAGAVAAIAASLVVTRVWRGSHPEPSNDLAAGPTPAALEPLSSPTPRATPASARGADGAVDAELIAVRDVWVRATVDGERAVERELEAGARVPLRATRAIVIRAGNAGAVRISIGGEDRGLLGAEGQVLTRTFVVSPPVNR